MKKKLGKFQSMLRALTILTTAGKFISWCWLHCRASRLHTTMSR